MRSSQLLRLFVVGLVLGSTLPLVAAEPAPVAVSFPTAAPAAAEATELIDLFEQTQSSADDSLFSASSWSCPFYTQICSTDSQCDAYCGGVGWGECISFGGARKCCACNT